MLGKVSFFMDLELKQSTPGLQDASPPRPVRIGRTPINKIGYHELERYKWCTCSAKTTLNKHQKN